MADADPPELSGWRNVYVIESRRGPRGHRWWAHVATAQADPADKFNDLQVLNGSAQTDAPALFPLAKDSRQLIHRQQIDQPTRAAGSLFLRGEILAVRIPPRTDPTGTLIGQPTIPGLPPENDRVVLFELDPAAARFDLSNSGMTEEQALVAVAERLADQARQVREPNDQWALPRVELKPALLAPSDSYLSEAAVALARGIAQRLPGGRAPDHLVVMAHGNVGQAAVDGLPLIPSGQLKEVAAAAREAPKSLNLGEEPTLHGTDLTGFAALYGRNNNPARQALGAVLNGAFAYASASASDGYAVFMLNRLPEGFTHDASDVLRHLTDNLGASLSRDPETGLVLHRPAKGVSPLGKELARQVGEAANGIVVLGIHPDTGIATALEVERLVRDSGGHAMRVEGHPSLLAFVPADEEIQLVAALSAQGRVSSTKLDQYSSEGLQAAIEQVSPLPRTVSSDSATRTAADRRGGWTQRFRRRSRGGP